MNSRFAILCFFALHLLACSDKPETIELTWQRLESGTSDKLNAIHFSDVNHGIIIGGASWTLGLQLQTEDGGLSWTRDSIWRAELNALDVSAEGQAHAVGVGGRLFRKEMDRDWRTGRFLPGGVYRDLAFNEAGQGVMVSGAAFQDGRIVTIGADDALLSQDSFENELSAVCFANEQTVFAAGYGLLLRSVDGGIKWAPMSPTGDFFRDICFPNPNVGYLIGSSGSIFKSSDGGADWEVLRDGRKLSVTDVPFRAAFFTDAQRGYLVGEESTFWKTRDGGETWKVIKNAPPGDLLDIFVIGERGFIVGSDGGIFTFKDE